MEDSKKRPRSIWESLVGSSVIPIDLIGPYDDTKPSHDLQDVPIEISIHIISYLSHIDLCRMAKVCKFWKLLSLENKTWESLYSLEKWKTPTDTLSSWKEKYKKMFLQMRNWTQGKFETFTYRDPKFPVSHFQLLQSRILACNLAEMQIHDLKRRKILYRINYSLYPRSSEPVFLPDGNGVIFPSKVANVPEIVYWDFQAEKLVLMNIKGIEITVSDTVVAIFSFETLILMNSKLEKLRTIPTKGRVRGNGKMSGDTLAFFDVEGIKFFEISSGIRISKLSSEMPIRFHDSIIQNDYFIAPTSDRSAVCCMFSIKTGFLLHTISPPGLIMEILFQTNIPSIFISGCRSGAFYTIDLNSRKVLEEFPLVDLPLRGPAIFDSGVVVGNFFIANGHQRFKVWRISDGKLLFSEKHERDTNFQANEDYIVSISAGVVMIRDFTLEVVIGDHDHMEKKHKAELIFIE